MRLVDMMSRRSRRIAKWLLLGVATVFGLSLLLGLRVYADLVSPRYEPMDPLPQVGSLSAQTCRACHQEIYAAWAKSGHARAFTDPLYQAELKHQPAPFTCHRCHAPLTEQRKERVLGLFAAWPKIWPIAVENERFDPALQQEGVTCVACHQVEGAMVGPFADGQSPHPTQAGELRSPDFCGHCHQLGFEFIGKLDRPIIDTLTEFSEYAEHGGNKVCVDCHMPAGPTRPVAFNGPPRPTVDHSLRGPYDAQFVATGAVVKAIEISGSRNDGARAKIVIYNGTGHRLPTAEPQRSVRLRLKAVDANGNRLTETVQRFARPVNVPKLHEAGPDTTMAPRETRQVDLMLEGPLPRNAVALEASVEFYLWDPQDPVAIEAGLHPTQLKHILATEKIPLPPN